jgi:hypothetical protein
MARRPPGWIGIAIVALGAAISAVGIWYFVHNRPAAGAVIDEIAIDGHSKVVVRAEEGGPRSFIELHKDGQLLWQAFVPPYAGKKGQPAIAWSGTAISVRVVRDRKHEPRAEVFALARNNASKLGGVQLAPEHDPIDLADTGPITVSDHARSYEVVAGRDWHKLVAVDLTIGKIVWQQELGATPITAADVAHGSVVLTQGGAKRWFNVFTGKEDRSFEKVGMPHADTL